MKKRKPALEAIKDIAVSNWTLQAFAKSPASLIYMLDNPTPSSDDQILGSLVDSMIIGQPITRYVKAPDINRRTKAGREEWAAFMDACKEQNAEAVKAELWQKAEDMATQVLINKPVVDILNAMEAQITMEWVDRETGLKMKGRLDGIGDTIVEIKTAKDGTKDGFQRDAFNKNYHWQSAIYCDGAFSIYENGADDRFKNLQFGGTCPALTFIVIEKTPPYLVSIFDIGEDWYLLGRHFYRYYLDRYKECLKNDDWKAGYEYYADPFDGRYLLEPPGWAMKHLIEV